MSSQANINNTPFNQKSPRPPEVGVSQRHRPTDIQTNGHCDSMTELAQWADAVKNLKFKYSLWIGLSEKRNYVMGAVQFSFDIFGPVSRYQMRT